MEAWLTASCPACRVVNHAPPRAAGKRARCGDCGAVVRLPATDGPATIDAGGPAPAMVDDGDDDDGDDAPATPGRKSGRLARREPGRSRESERVQALREGRQGLEGAWTILGGAAAVSIMLLWGAYASRHGVAQGPRNVWLALLALAGKTLGMAGSGLVSVVLTGGAVAFLVQAQGARNRVVAACGGRRRR